MNYKNLALFVALSCGLGWFLMNVLPNLIEIGEMWEQLVLIMVYLWSPALVAYILHKRLNKGSLGDLGFLSGRLDIKWLGKSILAPLGILAGTLVVVFFMGNLLGIPGFGEVVLGSTPPASSISQASFSIEPLLTLFATQNLPLDLFLTQNIGELIPMLLMFMVIGVIAGQIFFMGQEIAFRGFVFNETKSLGFLGSSLVTGLLWALWTLFPLLMRGYLDPTDLLHNTGLLVALSFVMSYLAVKTGSVISTAAFRGVFSVITVIGVMLVPDADPLVGSMSGIAGMIALLGATYLIIRFDKNFVEEYEELSFRSL